MGERERRLDEIRTERTQLENHLIDEFRSGNIGRREFVRRGAVVGMSVPLLGLIASACGVSREELEKKDPAQTGTPERGGTIRAGIIQPAGALDPIKVDRPGRRWACSAQSGEYLIWSDRELNAEPRLAESWKPNEDGSRVDVQDPPGREVPRRQADDAEDVAATFNRLADPDNGSNALSAFTGVLSKGGAKADRRARRSSSSSTRRTATSRTCSARTTTTRSSCPRTSTATGRRRSSAPARGSSRSTRPTWA